MVWCTSRTCYQASVGLQGPRHAFTAHELSDHVNQPAAAPALRTLARIAVVEAGEQAQQGRLAAAAGACSMGGECTYGCSNTHC